MDLISVISSWGPWVWVIAGLLLLALELFVPGGYLLWLGIAGVVTGLAGLVQPIPVAVQWLLFGILSIVTVVTWHSYGTKRRLTAPADTINVGASRLVGREGTLLEPITNGAGSLPIGDTVWRILGPDAPAGQRVKVVSTDGNRLKVELLP